MSHKRPVTGEPNMVIFMFVYRGYYTVARRYEFYVRVRYCSCHSNIKFISSRHRVISSIYTADSTDIFMAVYNSCFG